MRVSFGHVSHAVYIFAEHFGVRPLLGVFKKKTLKCMWLCVG